MEDAIDSISSQTPSYRQGHRNPGNLLYIIMASGLDDVRTARWTLSIKDEPATNKP